MGRILRSKGGNAEAKSKENQLSITKQDDSDFKHPKTVSRITTRRILTDRTNATSLTPISENVPNKQSALKSNDSVFKHPKTILRSTPRRATRLACGTESAPIKPVLDGGPVASTNRTPLQEKNKINCDTDNACSSRKELNSEQLSPSNSEGTSTTRRVRKLKNNVTRGIRQATVGTSANSQTPLCCAKRNDRKSPCSTNPTSNVEKSSRSYSPVLSPVLEALTETKPRLPVYAKVCSTPSSKKKKSIMPIESKLHEYDFEVDENEPKPKKKRKPILKIQRIRAPRVKKQVVVPLPTLPVQTKVLRSVTNQVIRSETAPVEHTSSSHANFVPSSNGVVVSKPALPLPSNPSPVAPVSPAPNISVAQVHSSPVQPLEPSICRTPLKSNVTAVSNDSPLPVLVFDSSHNTPKSNATCATADSSKVTRINSFNSSHMHGDISCSTPIKFHHNESSNFIEEIQLVEFDVNNCFGFDEPEHFEEPLVTPIKSTLHPPPEYHNEVEPTKPNESSSEEVDKNHPKNLPFSQVIKMLKFETGGSNEECTKSVDLSETPPEILPELYPIDEPEMIEDVVVPQNTVVASKTPRRSYDRPLQLRRNIERHVNFEEEDVEDEDIHHKEVYKPKKKKERKKGPTKKEEAELEKWAEAFNSQCDVVEGFNLCVE